MSGLGVQCRGFQCQGHVVPVVYTTRGVQNQRSTVRGCTVPAAYRAMGVTVSAELVYSTRVIQYQGCTLASAYNNEGVQCQGCTASGPCYKLQHSAKFAKCRRQRLYGQCYC